MAGLPGAPDAELAGALLRLRGWALYHLNALGDQAQRAIVIGEPLIADTERALGPDDPDTLAARNNLANAYQTAGRIDEAIVLHEQVVEGRERTLGPDHPQTVQSRQNLAAAYRAAGRTDGAATYEQSPTDPEAVAPQEQVLVGPGAVVLHEQVLADRERTLGPDDPDTLAARNNLAVAYQTAGRIDEAIALHEQALADRERVLGPDHPGTLNSRSNLAVPTRRRAGPTRRSRCTNRSWPTGSGCWARTTPTPIPRGTTWPTPAGRQAACRHDLVGYDCARSQSPSLNRLARWRRSARNG